MRPSKPALGSSLTLRELEEAAQLFQRAVLSGERDERYEYLGWADLRLRWLQVAQTAIDKEVSLLQLAGKLRITMIDDDALAVFRRDWMRDGKTLDPNGFEWDVFTRIPYYQEMADRFEAAVWLGDDLVGMGIGEADLEVGYVARDFVERAPTAAGEAVRGRIVPIMNLCLETWAEIKGAEYVCIFDPNLPSIRRLATFGFEYVDAVERLGEAVGPAFYGYCQKRVAPSAPPLPFVYSPVDLEELGEACDPYDRYGNQSHVPEAVTREAQRIATEKGLTKGE